MKPTLFITLCLLVGSSMNQAQTIFPYTVEEEDKEALRDQNKSIAMQIRSVVKEVSPSVVSIQCNIKDKWEMLGYGTVTDFGIVVKWSEISNYLSVAELVDAKGRSAGLKPIGVYPEYDLALLSDEMGLTPIQFDMTSETELGDFLVLSGVGGMPAGFGVTSVKARSLRETDKAFLGVQMNFENRDKEGVLLNRVLPNTAAAQAGIRAGDRLLSINKQPLGSAMETRSVIQKLKPGVNTVIELDRAGEKLVVNTILQARQEAPRNAMADLNRMETMGGDVSLVRDRFPNVIQTDIKVKKNTMGAPAVNLNGELVGLAISRSRMKTHLIPAADLQALLSKPPTLFQNMENQVTNNGQSLRVQENRGHDEMLREFLLRNDMDRNNFPLAARERFLEDLMEQLLKDDRIFKNQNLLQPEKSTKPKNTDAMADVVQQMEMLKQQMLELENKLKNR